MLATTIDLPPAMWTQTTSIQLERSKTANPMEYSLNSYSYRANNSVSFMTLSVDSPVIQHSEIANYQPKTELGKRLVALRQAHIAKGGRLLSAEEINEELKFRRGGINA